MGKTLDFIFNLDVFMNNGFNGQMLKAGQAISGLNEKIQKLNKASGNITGFQKQTQKLETLRQKLSAAQAKVKDMQTLRRQGELIDPKAFTKANEEAARLRGLVQDNERALGEYRRELQGAGVDTSRLGTEQERLASKIQQAQKAQAQFAAVKSKLTWGNLKADVTKAYGFLKPFEQPIQVNMNFEQAMAQVRAVKTMTDTEFTSLEMQAKELGASTAFSATQAANTQENLARAGMSVTDIKAAMPAVLSMAGAEGMDLAQAGSIIAKGLGGMGLEGKYAVRLADVLAYTSASSNTNIAEIGEAFKVVAPVLSQQGATMEQIAAYIGVMANKGYTGSEAGNAIASTTMRLAGLPTKARNMLLGIGLDPRMFRTQSGGMVELPEIMRMIDSAMTAKNLGENQRLEIISEVFGKNQGKAMSAFLSASVAGDTDLMQNGVTLESFKKAEEMNKTRNDTLKGDVTSLSSALEGLMIKIGEALTPINRLLTQTLTTAIQKLTSFMTEHSGFFDLMIRACYAFGGIKIAGSVLKYFRLGMQYLSALRAVKIAEKGTELVTAGANAGMLSRMLSGLLHPIAALKTAFTGLWGLVAAHPLGLVLTAGMALVGLITYWDDLKAWWNSWKIDDVWAKLPDWAQDAITELKTLWDSYWPDWKNIAEQAVNYVGNLFKGLADKLLGWLDFEMPSWLGGGKAGTVQVKNSNAALQGYMPPEITNAKGGIYSSPIWTWAAEDGAEAIIPLTDKSRGIPLVMKAAQMLGMTPKNSGNVNSPIQRLSGIGQVINQARNLTSQNSILNTASTFTNQDSLMNSAGNLTSQSSILNSVRNLTSQNSILNTASTLTSQDSLMNSAGNLASQNSILNSREDLTNQNNILNQERQMMNYVTQPSNNILNSNTNALRAGSMTFNPTYNITVSGENGTDTAENIRSVIEDTMNEIMSRMERLSYA